MLRTSKNGSSFILAGLCLASVFSGACSKSSPEASKAATLTEESEDGKREANTATAPEAPSPVGDMGGAAGTKKHSRGFGVQGGSLRVRGRGHHAVRAQSGRRASRHCRHRQPRLCPAAARGGACPGHRSQWPLCHDLPPRRRAPRRVRDPPSRAASSPRPSGSSSATSAPATSRTSRSPRATRSASSRPRARQAPAARQPVPPARSRCNRAPTNPPSARTSRCTSSSTSAARWRASRSRRPATPPRALVDKLAPTRRLLAGHVLQRRRGQGPRRPRRRAARGDQEDHRRNPRGRRDQHRRRARARLRPGRDEEHPRGRGAGRPPALRRPRQLRASSPASGSRSSRSTPSRRAFKRARSASAADYDGALMSSIAEDGAGGYYYLRDAEQIAPALSTELDKRLDPVATAVEVRVRLKKGVDLLRVYGSRRLSEAEAARVRDAGGRRRQAGREARPHQAGPQGRPRGRHALLHPRVRARRQPRAALPAPRRRGRGQSAARARSSSSTRTGSARRT